jgi:hypothetical protein
MHPLATWTTAEIIKPQFVVEKLTNHRRQRHHHHRGRPESDVGGPVLYHSTTPATADLRRARGYGVRPARRHRRPDGLSRGKTVIDIAGDGSIQMNIQELATAREYHCPVKIAILNNNYLGMVRQWQELFYDKRYASTTMEVAPDFVNWPRPTAPWACGPPNQRSRTGDPGGPRHQERGDHGLSIPAKKGFSRWCRRARPPPKCSWSRQRPTETALSP